MYKHLISIFALIVMTVYGCTESKGERGPVFETLPEIRDIMPEKPVKIKLKRNTSGKYSWDLSGDNASHIIEADASLRKVLDVK